MNFEKYKEQMVEDTIALVNINSIFDEETISEKAPFGEGIDKCLDEAIKISKRLGFRTYRDPNGYYGYAEIGEGEEYIALLCHLDVVTEGDIDLWQTKPFEGVRIKDEIFGRGSCDDKGPTIVSLYTLKAILDSNIALTKRIRVIFGTDEETLWRGIEVYKKHEKEPFCSFAPDGSFPFSYAEKGLLQLRLTKDIESDEVIFGGGKNYNSVASNCTYCGELVDKLIEAAGDELEYKAKDDCIEIIGVPSHAMVPHVGKNAVLYFAELLKKINIQNNTIKLLTEVFNYDYSKTALFKEEIKDETGVLTANVGAVVMDERVEVKLDLRVPVTFKRDDIIKKVKQKVSEYGFDAEQYSYLDPLYVPLDSKYLEVLLSTYQEVTGDFESRPKSHGGGTYARVFSKNSVCYGPKLKGFTGFVHEPNERMDINSMIKGMEIYYKVLLKLNELESL